MRHGGPPSGAENLCLRRGELLLGDDSLRFKFAQLLELGDGGFLWLGRYGSFDLISIQRSLMPLSPYIGGLCR